MMADKPYTDADVELVARTFHAMCGVPGGEPTDICRDDARTVLDALIGAGWRPDGDLAKQVEETQEVAAELAEERTTADEMTRAVKRLRDELTDAQAEARGARSDYRELKGFNAELADERDGLLRLLAKIRLDEAMRRVGW